LRSRTRGGGGVVSLSIAEQNYRRRRRSCKLEHCGAELEEEEEL
jgi:hypothetical protein